MLRLRPPLPEARTSARPRSAWRRPMTKKPPAQTVRTLAEEENEVVKGVILHQQPRWGALVGQQRQLESWWKHEIATALCALACRSDLLPESYWPDLEVKPRDFKVKGATGRGSIDVYFGRWGAQG